MRQLAKKCLPIVPSQAPRLVPHLARGFTLLEIMIVVVIMSVLLATGTPALRAYMMNNKILANAESFLSGLQQARTEAVRSNTTVSFVMTSATDLSATAATPDVAGRSWIVSAPDPDNPAQRIVISSKLATEGGGNTVAVAGTAATVVFNSLGATNLGAIAIYAFSPVGGSCGGDIRCINVVVTPGGRTQICDPAIASTALADSRRCITT
ncbi:MAG: prepilin-type N-terminal cleavage/methylation domain-containing protein [Gammaproteobacteria bacterium]|nr:prepilin-type N-terminal cleavage/methylation domain-containing protein [Gammaproteobacteria bacterium]